MYEVENIVSWSLTGAGLGARAGPIGAVFGGIGGASVGALVSFWGEDEVAPSPQRTQLAVKTAQADALRYVEDQQNTLSDEEYQEALDAIDVIVYWTALYFAAGRLWDGTAVALGDSIDGLNMRMTATQREQAQQASVSAAEAIVDRLYELGESAAGAVLGASFWDFNGHLNGEDILNENPPTPTPKKKSEGPSAIAWIAVLVALLALAYVARKKMRRA